MFKHLNQLNLSMQGENQNLLISTDKMVVFKGKLLIWKRMEMIIWINMFLLAAKTMY